MTSRADFTEDEWARLQRAPLVVAVAISVADPGGPISSLKESRAAVGVIGEAAADGAPGGLVRDVARDVAGKLKQRENPLAGFTPDRRNPRPAILSELRAVYALLQDKGTPDEIGEFREWLRTIAQRTATAAVEGGFFGIGGELVSEREQQMLETLGQIFGAGPS